MSAERLTLASIVATLGPASDDPAIVARLIEAGASVFRLNFSHGTREAHAARLATVRREAERLDRPVAVLGDLPGPKIRVGPVPGDGIDLAAGTDVLIASTPVPGEPGVPARLGCTYAGLAADVRPGHRVLINDGALRLLAVDPAPGDPRDTLRCRVTLGGRVTSAKGINLPDTELHVPALTDRDIEWMEWAVEHGLDYLALSFVRTAAEVIDLRQRLAGLCPLDYQTDATGAGAAIPVIAKIEKPQAVHNIDAIAAAADGLMVARGDLGVEMDLAQVPVVQRRVIGAAAAHGRPCIVATQMLETMIERPQPTRAETSDVAHAIFDGADAVMLSGETAVGRYPVLAVETMRRVVAAAEASVNEEPAHPSPPRKVLETRYRTAALAHGAWYTAHDLGARLVVCWSQTGGAARYLSQTGFRIPVIAYSSHARETRRMALLRGVTALRADPPASGSLREWNERVDRDLVSRGWARPGDPVLLLAGRPLGESGETNAIVIHYVGNPATGFMNHQ